jgi:hypothetical protein
MSVARAFFAAYQEGRPFQISKHHAEAFWNFAPTSPQHWAHCPTRDMNCFFLPLSSCPTEIGRDDAPRGVKPTAGTDLERFLWLRHYAFRPQQRVRQQLFAFLQKYTPSHYDPAQPCAAIHVRRGDIAFGKGRRYAAVEEYLHAGNITQGETVVLLTDDISTIEEVERYHRDDYHWIYLNRPRFRGSQGGFEGFVPSEDPAFEVLAIMAEAQLASRCNKLVHGKSGFVNVIAEEMEASGHSFRRIYLNTQLNKAEQHKMDPKDRAKIYLDEIQKRHEE